MMIAILKGKVRSERGAKRVTSKAKQANSIAPYILPPPGCQLLVFDDISSRQKVVLSHAACGRSSPCFPRNPGA